MPDGSATRTVAPHEWMDPRWFAADFVALYEQVKETDPDIREEYGKWAHNAKVWLADTEAKSA